MESIIQLYVTAMFLSMLITGSLAWYSWQRRNAPGATAFSAMMLIVTLWMATSSWNVLSLDPATKLFINKIGYVFVLSLPVAWFAFSIQYSQKSKMLSRTLIGILLIIPLFLELMILTGYLWSTTSFKQEGSFLQLTYTFSNLIWAVYTYCDGLIIIGSFLILKAAKQLPKLYHSQSVALLVGVCFPVIINSLYLLHLTPLPTLDFTPLSFALSGVAFFFGLFRYKLFSIVPIAHGVLVENMSLGFVVLNARQRIDDINPAAEQILGCTFDAAKGKTFSQLFPHVPGFAPEQFPDQCDAQEIAFETGDEAHVFEVRSSPIKLNPRETRAIGHIIILQDITPRILAERNLAASLTAAKELNEVRARLITNTSHEFRTPLSVILSSTELLEHYSAVWPLGRRKEHLQRIKDAVQHMTTMVDEILVVGKVDAGKFKTQPVVLDVVTFCEMMLEEIQFKDCNRHKYVLETTGSDIRLCIDKILFRQVVINLLDNAAKYSPEKSTVSLQFDSAEGWLHMDIIDHGLGIPEKEIPHLGEPFYRGENVTHLSGTGLGLTIVLKSLELIGGNIEFLSTENAGTCVRVSFP